jgi:TolB protein
VDSLFVTKGGSFRFNFCWAPDGRSIAWIRSHSTFSQVLVIHDLESGVDLPLTDGNENLDAMAWTKDKRIIFSSNRGGNTNLWVIPASGGEAVQLTKGGGPDIGLSISASGNELVYLQQQRVGYLWTANIDGSALRQISFDEREAWEPSFSPDKKRIAFVMNDPDPLTEKSDVYIMDRDGNNRRRLTNGNPLTRFPVWSPDGRRIMYTVPPTGRGADTSKSKIYVVDADDPGVPKLVGENFGVLWVDNDHLLALDGTNSYVVTISAGTTRRFFTDSLSVWGFPQGRFIGYYDRRPLTRGWWMAPLQPGSTDALLQQDGELVMPRLAGTARKVSSAPSFLSAWTSRMTTGGEVLQYVGDDQVRRISFLSSTEKVLPARFPGIVSRSIETSEDGKEVVFATPRLSSRLVLLEQVFQ